MYIFFMIKALKSKQGMLTIPVPHMRPPAMQTGLDPNRLTRKLESGPQAKAMVPVTDPMIDT